MTRSVIIILTSPAGGGAEVTMLGLARWMGEHATLDVSVYSIHAPSESGYEFLNGVRFRHFGGSLFRCISCLSTKTRGTVMISTTPLANFCTLCVSILTLGRLRWILRVCNNIREEYSDLGLLRRVIFGVSDRAALVLSTRVIAISESLGAHLRSTLPLSSVRTKVSAIPNPLLLPDLVQQLRTDPGDGLKPYVLAVGRLTPQKDYPMMIRAFSRSQASRTHRLVVAGEGPLLDSLSTLAESLGTTIVFLGHRTDAIELMRGASVFLHTARYEGFGRVILEALACRVPVVATNCCFGPSDILENGRFGRLVPVSDELSCARAIDEAASFGINYGCEELENHLASFSNESVFERYIDAIKSC